MLKLHTLAEWMHGFLDPERPYGLPEEVYNDVIPSGVHSYNRTDLFSDPPSPVSMSRADARPHRHGTFCVLYFCAKQGILYL